MNLLPFFKAVLDEDKAPVVICDLQHTIVYMNPVACERYADEGGADLLGKSLLDCHNTKSNEMINRVIGWFREDIGNNRIFTFRNQKENKDVYMVALRDESGDLIGYYEKHEYRSAENSERYDFGNHNA